MLTATATFAVFLMLGISSLAVFWAKRVRLPHTVFLVVIGLCLGILSELSFFSFFTEFQLTPELLFYLLLPTLIFESAYNIRVRRLVEESAIILLLAVVSLLISTVTIGVALYYGLQLFGITVPLIFTILFGALISATDPVAVLALFKDFGAPRRLSLIFEGESLFNDATAVALFLIIIETLQIGFHGTETVVLGIGTFLSMMIGGALFGLLCGGVFALLIGATRENEIASITLTIVLAHTTFILAEIISEHVTIGGFEFGLSSIVATTVASIFMGNYGRSKINPRAEEFVEKLWSQLAFMSNSIIFILIGVIFITLPSLDITMLFIILMTIVVVASARALSVYPIVGLFNSTVTQNQRLPRAWQHLLSWGSLRGALAVTMVLLVPKDLSIPGWTLVISPQEFLLSLTVGCIFATLFVKATTIEAFIKKLKLNTLTELERVEDLEARALISHEITERLARYKDRGYIEPKVAEKLSTIYSKGYQEACDDLCSKNITHLSERVLRMFAIGIEKRHLRELYDHGEVNERVFRRITNKLELQFEAIDSGEISPDAVLHTSDGDLFERLYNRIYRAIRPLTPAEEIADKFTYYRAQTIISRKVLKELGAINQDSAEHIFNPEALSFVTTLYTTYKEQSHKKMEDIEQAHPEVTTPLANTLAQCGVQKIKENLLKELYERELITPKLYLTLNEEF